MALTITYKDKKSILDKCSNDQKMITGTLAFDSSYPSNGESMDLSHEIPSSIHLVLIEPKIVSGEMFFFAYDYTNKKVIAYHVTQAVNEAGAAAYTIVVKEVTNTADLSGLTDVRFVAIGK